ncbi:site-specific integrase [Actinomadura keratinilytica]|uniref:site-specific integrase n=1 Tax=Actinomadura keratinilytica TaxID=547461 RepID=UPI003614AE8D
MKGTTYKRCNCRDPETGKYYNQKCPQLSSRRHGSWMFDVRIDITSRDGHRLKRAGYDTQTDAKSALDHVNDLIKLAKDDGKLRRRIGDLIVEKSKRGGELPTVEDVRRKLGAGIEIDAPSMTLAAWLEDWLAGKRTLKASARLAYRKHMDHWLIPHLGEIPLDKLRAEHIGGLFDLIEEFNAEIVQARKEKRKPRLPGDTRKVKKITGPATQHRIFATLRNALNVAVKRRHIDYNPCMSVELPPEKRPPARVWSPEQVVTFLEKTADDRLGLLYRIILLRGLRRGRHAACGTRTCCPRVRAIPTCGSSRRSCSCTGSSTSTPPRPRRGSGSWPSTPRP